MHLLAILGAAIVGFLVYVIGSLFDKTTDNRYAGVAALVIFVALVASSFGLLN